LLLAQSEWLLKEAGQLLENVQPFDVDIAERIRARHARLFPFALDLTDPSTAALSADGELLGPDDIQRETTSNGIACEFRGYALDTLVAEMQGVLVNADGRVKDPIYHVILSWPAHEHPTNDEAFACARHAMAAVGMAEHQYLAAIHRDTDNTHVHITVNRVHPESYRAVYPKQDFFVLDRAMRELELRYGWSHDAGPYTVIERNGVSIIERSKSNINTKEKMPSAAADLERFTGETSFFTYIRGKPRQDVLAILKEKSPSWGDLHSVLAKHGLALRPKGQGFAIYDTRNDATPPIKASDMHESLSRTRLERKLGSWTSPEIPSQPSILDEAAYDRRREIKRNPAERENRRQARADERRQLRADYQAYRTSFVVRRITGDESRARYKEIADIARARRREIAQTVSDPKHRKALYSVIAFEALTAREILKAELAKRRVTLRADPINRPLNYRQWVEAQAAEGAAAAISQLRGWAYADTRRQAETSRQQPGIADPDGEYEPVYQKCLQGWQPVVHRDGRISYRNPHGNQRFCDHGQQILLEGDAADDRDAILAALLLAHDKYHGQFILTGTPEFQRQALQLIAETKLHITLRDPDQARQLQEIVRLPSPTSGRGRFSP